MSQALESKTVVRAAGTTGTNARAGRGRMGRNESMWAGLFLGPYLLFFVTFVLAPVLYGFYISLHDWHVLSKTIPFVGFSNYSSALGDEVFRIAIARTALFTLMIVPTGNAVSMGLALMLNSVKRGSTFFKVAFYMPVVMSVAVTCVVWRWLYNTEFGVLNYYVQAKVPWLSSPDWALPSIVIMSIWWGAGGNMLVYLAALKAVPKEQMEAASLDGAGSLGQFRHITLPNLRGVILFCVVMSVIAASQIFAQTLILTGGGPADSTLTVMLYMYQTGFGRYQLGYASAVAYIIFIVLFLLGVTQLRSMSRAMQAD